MSLVIAEVVTSCEEDEFRRVCLKLDKMWIKSKPAPSVNGIPLYKGDIVIVDISLGFDNPLVLGRLRTAKQNKISPKGDGVLIYETRDGDSWAAAWGSGNRLTIKNSEGTTIVMEGKGVTVTADTVNVKSKDATVKSDNITLDGKVKIVHPVTPDQAHPGALCGLPVCLFSGAPHSNDSTT